MLARIKKKKKLTLSRKHSNHRVRSFSLHLVRPEHQRSFVVIGAGRLTGTHQRDFRSDGNGNAGRYCNLVVYRFASSNRSCGRRLKLKPIISGGVFGFNIPHILRKSLPSLPSSHPQPPLLPPFSSIKYYFIHEKNSKLTNPPFSSLSRPPLSLPLPPHLPRATIPEITTRWPPPSPCRSKALLQVSAGWG